MTDLSLTADNKHAELVEIIRQAKQEYSQDYTDRTEDSYIAEALLNAGYRQGIHAYWEPVITGLVRCSCCHKEQQESLCDVFCSRCGAMMY